MSTTASLEIAVHPLVLMSIADHYTRSTLQNNTERVLGLLYGTQDGRTVHVTETVEMAYTNGEEGPQPALSALENDMKLCK